MRDRREVDGDGKGDKNRSRNRMHVMDEGNWIGVEQLGFVNL